MAALIVLIAACLVSEYFWIIVGIIALAVAIRYIVKFADASNDRQIARINRGRELATRADQQHQWTIEGDDRGTYGRYPPATAVNSTDW